MSAAFMYAGWQMANRVSYVHDSMIGSSWEPTWERSSNSYVESRSWRSRDLRSHWFGQ